jgi:hypothetical protein
LIIVAILSVTGSMAMGAIQISNNGGFSGVIPSVGQTKALFSGAISPIVNQGNALFSGQVISADLLGIIKPTKSANPLVEVKPLNRTVPLVNATKT